MTTRRILMVAGEASADRHAAYVVRAVRQIMPGSEIFGMGGPEMAGAGMECTFSMGEISVMGFTDVFPKLLRILKVQNGLKRLMDERRPDIFIPVDLPDFNMRLAGHAKSRGLPVLYYIAPQAWAWRTYRARTLARITDGMAVIFPFEEQFFKTYGVNARYVGHPFLEETDLSRIASWPPKRIGIMPGSRRHEIEKILPVMLASKRRIEERHPDLSWHLPVAPGIDEEFIKPRVDGNVRLERGLPEVDLAMVKSGTSSLEMALLGIPEVICYKTSALNYTLAKAFIKIKNIGMPNIIARKTIVPELIQHDLTPEDLARTILLYVEERSLFEAAQRAFNELKQSLGDMKASENMAAWSQEIMERT
ncbi:MAG TPA: lipid-A-disaccharide synthase [Desulfomonilia bacterium]|nr:lipid-A-disaccharide synthase [Desulfomonilia bacterium]